MKIYFISGFFPDNQLDFIYESSSGVVQNAAHAFQISLLKGLDSVFENGIDVFNLPFVGSYPKRFNEIYFPSTNFSFSNLTNIRGVGFLNLSLIKHFSRFFALLFNLIKCKSSNKDYFLIYSMHLPFIAAVVFLKKIKLTSAGICLVVPDLPEYMSDKKSFTYGFFKKIDMAVMKTLTKDIDLYVLLTKEMSVKLNLKSDQYVVIEGIAESVENHREIEKSCKKFIFYSGTLAKRYGVCDLVNAFHAIDNDDYELWICGDGDARKYIDSVANDDKRIKYLGQIPRDKVLKIQKMSTLLVNPRTPEGEYTKYSFPSKIMEYMASGSPVLMHRLPGIPDEYFQYCYTPKTFDVSGLKACLEETLNLPLSELASTGLAAKDFVINNKSSLQQANKIKDFLLRNTNV